MINSGPLTGLNRAEATAKVVELLEHTSTGAAAITFRLRDWLICRQRYWGTPIPIIHCPACGEVPVPDEDLPVELPELSGAELIPRGRSPLAAVPDWVNVACPRCGRAAERDSDTMDTFVDSSWYFFRYCSPDYPDGPFDVEQVRRWIPVEQYIGGKEHAILHLLYTRFITKVLHDLGLIDFTEPFRRLMNQGQVLLDGKAMSKSTGNLVELGQQIDRFGVDVVRLALLFSGPPEDDIDWADVSPSGLTKFLSRVHRLATEVSSAAGTPPDTGDLALRQVTHRTVHEVQTLIESRRFNVAIARTMELVSAPRRTVDANLGSSCDAQPGGGGDPAVREATR